MKKPFKKYAEIKKVLEENKISSKDLEKYLAMKKLRHERYKQENKLTDEEMEVIVGNM